MTTRPRRRRRDSLRALGALAIASTALVAVSAPLAASAAELNAITSVTITEDPGTGLPIHAWERYEVSATWAVPNSAVSGDTFTLNFPPAVVAYADTIELRDGANNLVGTCDVTSGSFHCTLGTYVDTHDNVGGSLYFFAQSSESTEEDSYTFTGGTGVVFDVPIPGGGVEGAIVLPPTTPEKFGWVHPDGESLMWRINIPGEYLTDSLELTDTYDSELTLAGGITVQWALDSDFGTMHPVTAGTGPNTYTFVSDPSTSSFTLVINEPVTDGSRTYQIEYRTLLPDDVTDGDVFGNSFVGGDIDLTAVPVEYVDAGGNGSGDGPGSLSITKSLTGSGADDVPAGTTYTVEYSYHDEDDELVAGTLTLTPGVASRLDNIPGGTVVTLSEVTPVTPGVEYGEPIFSGSGVVQVGLEATVTVVEEVTILVGLENPVTVPEPGGFSILKTVSGDGAGEVPAGTTYTVNYSYTDASSVPVAGALILTPGVSATVNNIPAGTVVTLSEVAPTGAAGYLYGAPVFSGAGVTTTSDGAQLTIGEGTTVAVGLLNPVDDVVIPGGFNITKSLSGTGASLVPESTTYMVNYSYEITVIDGDVITIEMVRGTLELSPGATDGLADIPAGTIVTLTEVTPTAIGGATYGTPIFSGEGVTQTGTSAQFVIGEDTTIEIELENPITTVPPGLASTGAPMGAPLLGATLVLLLGGAMLMVRRGVLASRR